MTRWSRLCWRSAFILTALLTCIPAHADGLRIYSAEIPPLVFEKDGIVTGFCVDVVHEIQRRIGDHTPIELLPWARAYQAGVEHANVVLICPRRTPEREAHFQWVGPLFTSETNLYAKRGSGLRIHSLDEAKAAESILVPRESYTDAFLRDAGFTNLQVANTSLAMMVMLFADRSPLMAVDRLQLPEMLKGAKASEGDVELVFRLISTDAYITFNKNGPGGTVQAWRSTLDLMMADGSYQAIFNTWFPAATH